MCTGNPHLALWLSPQFLDWNMCPPTALTQIPAAHPNPWYACLAQASGAFAMAVAPGLWCSHTQHHLKDPSPQSWTAMHIAHAPGTLAWDSPGPTDSTHREFAQGILTQHSFMACSSCPMTYVHQEPSCGSRPVYSSLGIPAHVSCPAVLTHMTPSWCLHLQTQP